MRAAIGLKLILYPLFLAGCSAVSPREGFKDVELLVNERAGTSVHWNTGTDADRKVDEKVRELLSRELSPDAAVQVALLRNRRLQATYESLGIAQADLVAAGLLQNPVFDAELRFQRGGGVGAELGIIQDFVDVFFIPLRKRQADARLRAAKLEIAGEVLALGGEVRRAVYELQAATQEVEMRRKVVTATGASVTLAERLREAGNVTSLDVDNERALNEEEKVSLRAAEAAVIQRREELNSLLGLFGKDTTWTVTKRLPSLPKEEPALDSIEARVVEQSLELGALKEGITEAYGTLGLAAPLALFSGSGVGVSSEREGEGEWSGGPAFSLPIPFFTRGQPEVAAAAALLRQAEARFYATAVELRSKARAAHAELVAAADQARHYADVIVPLRSRIVRESQRQYNAMQVGPFQLLLAKRDEIDSGRAYIRALERYWLAKTEVELLLSGSTPTSPSPAEDEQESIGRSAARGGGH